MANSSDESKNVTTRKSSKTERREPEIWLSPSVDIFEDAEGITVVADMPGVSKDRLNLQVDRDSLTVEGEASIDMAKTTEALYADVRATRYQRSFSLSRELDIDAIAANLNDGVLRVRIPKTAETRPRKIEVHT